MRRAYTLAEILVVLFIIGVILSVAIKSSDMVESANVRSEVRKLERFEVAIGTTLMRKSKMASVAIIPGELGDEVPQYFLDNISLVDEDFITYKVPKSRRKHVYKDMYYKDAGGVWTKDGIAAISVHAFYTPHTLCIIESVLDDKHADKGRGVIDNVDTLVYDGIAVSALYPEDPNNSVFEKCGELPNHFEYGVSSAYYYYRLY